MRLSGRITALLFCEALLCAECPSLDGGNWAREMVRLQEFNTGEYSRCWTEIHARFTDKDATRLGQIEGVAMRARVLELVPALEGTSLLQSVSPALVKKTGIVVLTPNQVAALARWYDEADLISRRRLAHVHSIDDAMTPREKDETGIGLLNAQQTKAFTGWLKADLDIPCRVAERNRGFDQKIRESCPEVFPEKSLERCVFDLYLSHCRENAPDQPAEECAKRKYRWASNDRLGLNDDSREIRLIQVRPKR